MRVRKLHHEYAASGWPTDPNTFLKSKLCHSRSSDCSREKNNVQYIITHVHYVCWPPSPIVICQSVRRTRHAVVIPNRRGRCAAVRRSRCRKRKTGRHASVSLSLSLSRTFLLLSFYDYYYFYFQNANTDVRDVLIIL